MPSRGGEEAPKPASAAAKGYDDELHATADGNIGAAAAAAAVGAASAKRANSAASTPRTPQKQLLPSRPSSSSKSKKDELEEELPLDPNRVPSPAPLEDEEFDVAAAAAAAARSDAVLFPDEASRKRRSGSSSDDDDDGGEDGLRKRPTGGDGESSTDEDEGYRGAGDSHVGSRSGFLSFVDETREMRNPARSAADADARKKRRAEEKRKEKASAAKVAAPEQPKRGELVHAGRGQQQGGAEQEAAAAAEAEEEEEQGTTAPASKRAKNPSSRPTPPSSSFEAAGLSPSTAAHLRSLGFARPTPVQASAMPALCSGRDALVRAPTGSGKTLAYLAPIVDAVSGARACASSPSSSIASRGARALGSRAIVLAPTRELALQVTDVAAALTKRYHWVVGGALYGERGFCLFSPPPFFPPIFCPRGSLPPSLSLSLFTFPSLSLRREIAPRFSPPFPSSPCSSKKKKKTGGESRSSEKARLRKGVALLVATPGRLLDHLENTACFETRRVGWLVLDEADRLLDLGFEAKVAQVVGALEWRRAAAKDEEARDGFSPATASASAHSTAAQIDPSSLPPIPDRIQTVLVSATMGSSVEGLGGVSLVNPAHVGVDKGGEATAGGDPTSLRRPARTSAAATTYDGLDLGPTIPAAVSQRVLIVPARAKVAALAALLVSRVARGGRVLAFFSSCGGVEAAHALLTRGYALAVAGGRSSSGSGGSGGSGGGGSGGQRGSGGAFGQQRRRQSGGGGGGGLEADDDLALDLDLEGEQQPPASSARLLPNEAPLLKLHGGMRQAERTAAFLDFSRAKGGGVLLATDVAARGLDFPSLSAVVQFDPPGEASEYAHRVGRAGRAGEAGEAILLLLPSEAEGNGYGRAARLPPSAALACSAPRDPLPELDRGLARLPLPPPPPLGRRPRFADEHPGARALAAGLLSAVSRDADLRAVAVAGFRASVRSYATFPAHLKPVCHVKRLHLGHVAHCFGLRDAPSVFGRDDRFDGAGRGGGGNGGGGNNSSKNSSSKRKR